MAGVTGKARFCLTRTGRVPWEPGSPDKPDLSPHVTGHATDKVMACKWQGTKTNSCSLAFSMSETLPAKGSVVNSPQREDKRVLKETLLGGFLGELVFRISDSGFF